MNIGIEERGVTQTVAEGIANGDFCSIVIAVADVQALPVFGGALLAGEVIMGGVVFQLQWPSLVQLTGGVDFSQNCPGHGRSTGLTAEITMDGSTILVSFRHDEGRTAGKY